ncbi:MAG TPA: hypothetical protein VHG32_18945, partial [Thermoanaerobaculia bacterium]|nr:hypothetical protein [Thermoanaerobaculia bacterium]
MSAAQGGWQRAGARLAPALARLKPWTDRLAPVRAPLLALLAAFVAGGLLIAAVGDDPIAVYGLLLGSALSW